MTYTCKLCGTDSDTSEFYAGVTSRCKECHKASVRDNRAQQVEYYRAYDAERYKSDPRVRSRMKRYAATDAGKKSAEAAKKRWQAQNADKRAAHVLLGNAVRDGRVKKPLSCVECGVSGVVIHGHHADYAFPLSVKWVCAKCHRKEHT